MGTLYGFPCDYLNSISCQYLERFELSRENITDVRLGCRKSCGLCTEMPSAVPFLDSSSDFPSYYPSAIPTMRPRQNTINATNKTSVYNLKNKNITSTSPRENYNYLGAVVNISADVKFRPAFLSTTLIFTGVVFLLLGTAIVRNRVDAKRYNQVASRNKKIHKKPRKLIVQQLKNKIRRNSKHIRSDKH